MQLWELPVPCHPDQPGVTSRARTSCTPKGVCGWNTWYDAKCDHVLSLTQEQVDVGGKAFKDVWTQLIKEAMGQHYFLVQGTCRRCLGRGVVAHTLCTYRVYIPGLSRAIYQEARVTT